MPSRFGYYCSSQCTYYIVFFSPCVYGVQNRPDLGICLAKGIVLSFVSVMVFLPALTLSLYKLIDKTSHRRIMPEFRNIGKYVSKIFVPVAVIVAVVIVPSFLGQGKTSFLYGYGDFDAKRELGRSTIAINEKFGRTNILAILVPKGIWQRISSTDRLEKHPHVKT